MSRSSSADRVAFWRKLIARQASSRVTVGDLCRQAGVSTASFYAWRRRLKSRDVVSRRSSLGKQSSLVPVRVVADHGAEITVELVAAASETVWTQLPTIRVSIPSGFDETSIRNVLRAIMSAGAGGRGGC